MSKKKTVVTVVVKGKEYILGIKKKQIEHLPYALDQIISAFIAFGRMNGQQDCEINSDLSLLIADAWRNNGGCKDIVEEIDYED